MEAERAESTGGGHVAWRDGRVWLSAPAQMLVNMRDMLYDGRWEDFERDLQDRMADRPHVFDIVGPSSDMKDTIRLHLAVIEELRTWERSQGQLLEAKAPDR